MRKVSYPSYFGWIPVKKRLPKEKTEVLLLVPVLGKFRVRVGILTKDRKTFVSIGGAIEPAYFPFGTEPMFWKPLPKIPQYSPEAQP